MTGIYFYWFAWMAWVVVTFLFKQSKQQKNISIYILILIICSNLYVPFWEFSIGVAFIFILLTSCIIISVLKWKAMSYYLIVSIIVATAGTTFQLMYLFDPVMAIIKPAWMLAILLSILILLLVRKGIFRYILFMIGLCQAEMIYSLFLSSIHGRLVIGSFFFLDVLAIGFLLLFLWQGLETITDRLAQMTKKYTDEYTKSEKASL